MTATLILHLEGPLQAWGTAGAVATRRTHNLPQKSAILGMIRAAKGLKRIETWDELEELTFSVRVLKRPRRMWDFQTVRRVLGVHSPNQICKLCAAIFRHTLARTDQNEFNCPTHK